jgi:hypothetical protein
LEAALRVARLLLHNTAKERRTSAIGPSFSISLVNGSKLRRMSRMFSDRGVRVRRSLYFATGVTVPRGGYEHSGSNTRYDVGQQRRV